MTHSGTPKGLLDFIAGGPKLTESQWLALRAFGGEGEHQPQMSEKPQSFWTLMHMVRSTIHISAGQAVHNANRVRSRSLLHH